MKNTAVASDAPLLIAVTVAITVSLLNSEVKVAVATPPDVCLVTELEPKLPWSVLNTTSVPFGTRLPYRSLTVAAIVEVDEPSAVMLTGLLSAINRDWAVKEASFLVAVYILTNL
jgi:hypothetical protein